MLYIKDIKPSLNTQADSIHAKLFTWHFLFLFYLLLCFLPWELYPLDPQIFYLLFENYIFVLQYVAQYPDGTIIRTLETKTFQLSVNEVFWMKAEPFSFKMKVLAIWKLAKQSRKTPFYSGE